MCLDATSGMRLITELASIIERLPRKSQQRIQELYVVDDNQYQVRFRINLFKRLQNLTKLHVTTDMGWRFDLEPFFSAFPDLQELSLGVKHSHQFGRPSLNQDPANGASSWPDTVGKLRSLSLCSLELRPSLLDSLLGCCPQLQEPNLVTIKYQLSDNSSAAQTYQEILDLSSTFNYGDHFAMIARHCPILGSLHFSEHDGQDSSTRPC